jgi:serine/threonine protein kinase
MGEVYRARDTRLGRDVALKILSESLTRDNDRLHRFEQEARAVAALNHPNILALFDIGQHNGSPFLVSELLEGETLRSVLDRGPLPQRKTIDYGVQIAQGLAAAHEKGIVHRDLKPENIFVSKDGRIKILDFGLAKLAQKASAAAAESDGVTLTSSHTAAGVVMGTASYMAPEQVRGEPADPRTDIFAFGAVLYEMLSGQRAFRRETPAETMTAVLREDPPEMTDSSHPISPALDRIVRRCLEKTPEQRFQSAKDLSFAQCTFRHRLQRCTDRGNSPQSSRDALDRRSLGGRRCCRSGLGHCPPPGLSDSHAIRHTRLGRSQPHGSVRRWFHAGFRVPRREFRPSDDLRAACRLVRHHTFAWD